MTSSTSYKFKVTVFVILAIIAQAFLLEYLFPTPYHCHQSPFDQRLPPHVRAPIAPIPTGWKSGKLLEPPTELVQAAQEACLRRSLTESQAYQCSLAVVATAWKETNYDNDAVGDSGKSRSAVQIQYRLHGFSLEHGMDVGTAVDFYAAWRADSMGGLGRTSREAIRSWNGYGPEAEDYADAVIGFMNELDSSGIIR